MCVTTAISHLILNNNTLSDLNVGSNSSNNNNNNTGASWNFDWNNSIREIVNLFMDLLHHSQMK